MTVNSPLVVGVFQKEADAKAALKALEDAGFAKDQIGLALREGGVVTHSLLKDLVKLGVPEERGLYYESEYKAGRLILSVRADGREQDATRILQQYGAYDQGTQGSAAAYTTTGKATGTPATDDALTDGATEEARSLRLREEQLQVSKQAVQTGEVQLHKEVISEQKTIDVPVTHEEVFIERRPGSGQISDLPVGQDETIRVPVREEQATLSKTTVETGEVALGKQTVQEKKRVSETVRREEARLDTDGNPRVHADEDLLNP